MRTYQVEVLVEVKIDGTETDAFRKVDGLMQQAWEEAHPHGLDATWHYQMLEGCVADITEEEVPDD